jgi:ribosomal 50S subunit-recycling heat shock protein
MASIKQAKNLIVGDRIQNGGKAWKVDEVKKGDRVQVFLSQGQSNRRVYMLPEATVEVR